MRPSPQRTPSIRRALGIAVLLGALAAPHATQARETRNATQSGRAFATFSHEEIGIPRFAEVEPGLTRGGQPSEEGVRFLKEQGYRTIISFRKDSPERELVESLGMRYVEIPIRSGPLSATPPSEEQVRLFLSIVADSSSRPVFFHCLRGRDRTGAMTAIYRIHACGWSPEEAEEEMVALGYRKHYRKLMSFVRSWPDRMKALSEMSPVSP